MEQEEGGGGGAVMRALAALASQQCGPGSIPRLSVISGLNCWFSSLLRRVFSGYSGFPLSSKLGLI